MNLKEIGEFGFIERFKPLFDKLVPANITGIGDDCAIIPANEEDDWVVTTDMLIEDIHFLRDAMTPEQLGYKSLAVNLSDIASMGASATGSFLSIAIPKDVEVEYLDKFMEGYHQLSEKYKVPLLGGDTTSSIKHMAINVCVIGKCKKGNAKRRDTAEANDIVCVTGNLGDSAGGLQVVLNNLHRTPDAGYLALKHFMPEPRMDEGLFLSAFVEVHAMMDISDGIASDLVHILKKSGKAARIDIDMIPVSPTLKMVSEQQHWDVTALAVGGGEDYELLCTIEADRFRAVANAYANRFGKQLYPIGTIVQDRPQIRWFNNQTEINISQGGFNHFGSTE
jgi:thiamine-monophosphate kinase